MDPAKDIALPMVGSSDARQRMYRKIAVVHADLERKRLLADLQGRPFAVHPGMVVHLDETVAFLAEEVLRLRAEVEELKLEKQAD